MTQDFQNHFTLNHFVFVNKNCCLCKCLTELYFLSWLLVVFFAILIAVPFVFSRTWTSHAGVLKMPRESIQTLSMITHNKTCLVPRRLSFDENVRAKEGGKETTGDCTLPMVPCGSSPVTRFALASRKTRRLRRRLINSLSYWSVTLITVPSNTHQLALQICRSSKVRTGWLYGWFLELNKNRLFWKVFAKSPLLPYILLPEIVEFSSWKRFFECGQQFAVQRIVRASIVLNIDWVQFVL